MSTEFEKSFEILYNDAIANFETSRFNDSARGFEYLSQLCTKNGYVEDSIYFAYRTAVSHKSASNNSDLIKLYRNLGLYFLKYTVNLSEDVLIGEMDKKVRMDIMQTYQLTLKYTGDHVKRREIVEELIEMYVIECKYYPNEMDIYLEKAIKLAIELQMNEKSVDLITDLSSFYLHKLRDVIKRDVPDSKIIAKKYMEKVIELYRSIDFIDKINILLAEFDYLL